MAEWIFKDIIQREKIKDIEVSSAGIFAQEGSLASKNAVITMKNNKMDITKHKSRLLTKDIIKDSDVVLTMTRGHKNTVLKVDKILEKKVFTIKEFIEESGDILDPYCQSLEVYESTFKDIKKSIEKIINKIK